MSQVQINNFLIQVCPVQFGTYLSSKIFHSLSETQITSKSGHRSRFPHCSPILPLAWDWGRVPPAHRGPQLSLFLPPHLQVGAPNSAKTQVLATEPGRDGSVQLKTEPGAKEGTLLFHPPSGSLGRPLPLPRVPWSPDSRAGSIKSWLGVWDILILKKYCLSEIGTLYGEALTPPLGR